MTRHTNTGRLATLALAATLVLLAMPRVLAQSPPGALDAYVSDRLPPAERNYMRYQASQLPAPVRAAMTALDPSHVHFAVIDGSTDKIHYNRPEDAGSLVGSDMAPPISRSAGCPPPKKTPSGFDPGCTAGTGPYRRVYTVPVQPIPASAIQPNIYNVGYSAGGVVTVACKDGYHRPHRDDGDVYLGGWSTTPTKPGGNVDAGLQYNWKQQKGSTDSYSLFMNIAGVGYWSTALNGGNDGWFDGSNAYHIPCGAPTSDKGYAAILFSVQAMGLVTISPTCDAVGDTSHSCASYSLNLTVKSAQPNEITSISWIAPPNTTTGTIFGGWGDTYKVTNAGACTATNPCWFAETPCKGCIFKFMSSIAQKKPVDYEDKSTYTVSWAERSISCWINASCTHNDPNKLIALTAAMVDCSEYPVWGGTYQHGTRDCTNTPSGLSGVQQSVGVSNYSPTAETDAISLTY